MTCYIVYKEIHFSIRSPGIQGMAFGINKTFFQSLGGFDLGMKVWGAEQFELSIKVIILNETKNIKRLFKKGEKAHPSYELLIIAILFV